MVHKPLNSGLGTVDKVFSGNTKDRRALLLSELTVEALKARNAGSSPTVREGFKITQYEHSEPSLTVGLLHPPCKVHQSFNDRSVPQVVLDNEHLEQ
jgi:hypothetical protein